MVRREERAQAAAASQAAVTAPKLTLKFTVPNNIGGSAATTAPAPTSGMRRTGEGVLLFGAAVGTPSTTVRLPKKAVKQALRRLVLLILLFFRAR